MEMIMSFKPEKYVWFLGLVCWLGLYPVHHWFGMTGLWVCYCVSCLYCLVGTAVAYKVKTKYEVAYHDPNLNTFSRAFIRASYLESKSGFATSLLATALVAVTQLVYYAAIVRLPWYASLIVVSMMSPAVVWTLYKFQLRKIEHYQLQMTD